MQHVKWRQIGVMLALTALLAAGCDRFDWASLAATLDAPAAAGLSQVNLTETAIFGNGATRFTVLTVTVDVPTGRFRAERRSAAPVEGALTARDVATLMGLLEAADFFDLDSFYFSPGVHCCGVVHAEVKAVRAGKPHTVTSDGSAPEAFHDIVRFMEARDAPASAGLTKLTLTETVALGGSGGEVYLSVAIDAAAGTILVERRGADPVEGAISAEDVAALEALLEEVGFFDMRPDDVPASGCCGAAIFEVTVERDHEVFRVRASEETRPDALYRVLTHVRSLYTD